MTSVGISSGNFLYYNTPESELKTHYGDDFEQPFKYKITTQFAKEVVLIRLAAIAIFGTILALTSPTWMWPVVVIASGSYTVWIAYNHLLRQDPLVEAFYKIVGGKDQYAKLPEIVFAGEKTIEEKIKCLDWDALDQPLYRANTEDGRQILIVKALTRNPEDSLHGPAQVKTIFGFVEKLGPVDLKPLETEIFSPEINRFLFLFIHALSLSINENQFSEFIYSSSEDKGSGVAEIKRTYISSSIENDVANEFLMSW